MVVRTRNFCAILVAGFALASAWADDYVRLTANDDGENSSFYQSVRWSDKRVPHDDADYIVTNNFLLRGPKANSGNPTNFVFGGRSLTIGTASSSGRFGLHTDGEKPCTTVTNLILVKGQLRQIRDNCSSILRGTISVQSPAGNPFSVLSSVNNGRTIDIRSVISGEEGTGLLFSGDGASSHCTNYIYGANSEYYGSMTIGGAVGNTLIIGNVWGAGGDPSSTTPQGLVVKNGATLRFAVDPIQYVNRGLYVDASGGVLRQVGNGTHLFMPLAGEGTLTKTGSEQTTFNGTWTGVTLDVHEGTFAVQSDAPTPGAGAAVVISGGTFGLFGGTAPNLPITLNSGLISPCSTSTGDLVLSNATVTGGGVRIDYADGRYDTLTLDGDSSFTPSTFNVNVVNYQSPTDTNRYPVLVVPTSVGTLTEDMLVFGGSVNDEFGYPASVKSEVETVDGVQTLYISRTNAVVQLVTNQSRSGMWTTASDWSDGIGLRAGVDFLIDAALAGSDEYFAARTPGNNEVETFVGRSLTMYGTSSKTARVLIKSRALVADDIRLGQNGWVCGSGANTPSLLQYVTGTVTVASSAVRARPAVFATLGRTFEMRAELKGTGMVGVSSSGADSDATVVFTRPNPEFRGKFLVKRNTVKDDNHSSGNVRMRITSAECLGAAPTTLTTNVVEVWYGVSLEAPSDVTLDGATRGITFLQGSSLSAVSGAVFTVQTPLYVKGTLNKRGLGTVVLDSTTVVPVGGTIGCRVAEGCIQVNQPDTFWKFYRLRFVDGTALLVPSVPANEGIGTYGVAMSRDADESPFLTNDSELNSPYLPVKIDFGGTPPEGTCRVVLCSLTDRAAACLRGHIDVQTAVKGYRCTIEEDTVTYKSKALTRFTAVFRPTGACIIFR